MGVAADASPPGPLQATLWFDIIPGPTRASSCSGPDNPAHDAQKWSLARPRCPVCDRGLFRCFRGKLEPEPIAPLGLASSLLPVLRRSQEEGGTDQAGGSAVAYRHATDVRSPSEVKKEKKIWKSSLPVIFFPQNFCLCCEILTSDGTFCRSPEQLSWLEARSPRPLTLTSFLTPAKAYLPCRLPKRQVENPCTSSDSTLWLRRLWLGEAHRREVNTAIHRQTSRNTPDVAIG